MKKRWVFIAFMFLIILFLSIDYLWGDEIKLSAASDNWSATLSVVLTDGWAHPSPLTLQYVHDDWPIYIQSVDVNISAGDLSFIKQVRYATPLQLENKPYVVTLSETLVDSPHSPRNKREFSESLSSHSLSIRWRDANGQTYHETLYLQVLP